MRRDIFASVVVPLDNDLDILPVVVREISAVMQDHFSDYELIFIDDGSTDGTRSFFERIKAEVPCFRYFRLTRRFGLEVAIACGLEQAIGDVIVVFNPAYDPPERIPEFTEKANDTGGIVVGVEIDKFKHSPFYRLAYQVYYGLCKVFLPHSQVYGATHFMALTRTALNALLTIKDSFRYIRVLAMYSGFAVTKVPYEFKIRRHPSRRLRVLSLIETTEQMIVSYSDRPLRMAALLSAFMCIADFAFLFYVLAMRFFFRDIAPGWASTNFFNAIMFGLIFLVLAVICEYLAELRVDVKRRPLYVIQGEVQSNVMLTNAETRNVVIHEDRVEAISAANRAALHPKP